MGNAESLPPDQWALRYPKAFDELMIDNPDRMIQVLGEHPVIAADALQGLADKQRALAAIERRDASAGTLSGGAGGAAAASETAHASRHDQIADRAAEQARQIRQVASETKGERDREAVESGTAPSAIPDAPPFDDLLVADGPNGAEAIINPKTGQVFTIAGPPIPHSDTIPGVVVVTADQKKAVAKGRTIARPVAMDWLASIQASGGVKGLRKSGGTWDPATGACTIPGRDGRHVVKNRPASMSDAAAAAICRSTREQQIQAGLDEWATREPEARPSGPSSSVSAGISRILARRSSVAAEEDEFE